jgi:DNA-binding NarL/FixJ family response regulator
MKILMVDDHPLMADAVKTVLLAVDPTNDITHVTTINAACKTLDQQFDFDLVLLDLGLSDAQEFSGLKLIKNRYAEVPIVVMSADRQPNVILECLNLGAVGYVPKTSAREVLINALRLVASGNVYVPPEALAHAGEVGTMQLPNSLLEIGANERVMTALGMTERQREVLRLLLRGLPNKLICKQLDLAEGTIKVHVSAVLKLLGAQTRTQAVVAASRLGLKFE